MSGFAIIPFFRRQATGPMLVRGGIVGLNFAMMLALARWLGLAEFGYLAVNWGLAMVAAPILSFGGPLLLLRMITDGAGVSGRALIMQTVTLPAGAAVAGAVILPTFFPTVAWADILLAGFCVNLITCLASLMRGLGSVNLSMMLRDCGPQIALGLGAAVGARAQILVSSSVWMALIAGLAVAWTLRHPRCRSLIDSTRSVPAISLSLWGTSVLGMALAQVDIILGGSVMSPADVGLYAVLRRVANLVALPVSVATWVSAKDVSYCYKNGDRQGLQSASRAGSRIALLPGFMLFCGAAVLTPFIAPAGNMAFLVLLFGALLQVVFASGFTVATLCDLARFAVLSRALSLGIYIALLSFAVDPFMNALAYVTATTLGVVVLWALVHRRLGIDTSALALVKTAGRIWKPS